MAGGQGQGQSGFPAHAGMDPFLGVYTAANTGLPRTRGDGPIGALSKKQIREASPHTRGWTLHRLHDDIDAGGFPAHAGMDLVCTRPSVSCMRLPRTRGDGPCSGPPGRITLGASPHTRGWTRDMGVRGPAEKGFPAHAGMDPGPYVCKSAISGLPRTRGDGPWRAPSTSERTRASPHTRGWTMDGLRSDCYEDGFPAHAGMDPSCSPARCSGSRLPRTRGDGPQGRDVTLYRGGASPHTRGWTRGQRARAGR